MTVKACRDTGICSCIASGPELGLLADTVLLASLLQVEGSIFFCPTRLAASLCGGYTGDSGSRSLDGYIIVETNYRVIAGRHACTECSAGRHACTECSAGRHACTE